MEELSGHYIGRYHIIERLGSGGMATVFKAFDTRLEREVAIKIIRREAVTQENYNGMLLRFEREAKVLARLSHPNIVKVYDFGDHNGSPYLVMEYIPGGTLKQYTGQPMPYYQAARLLLPIASALSAAHHSNLIHRDVKPANILLTHTGQPMLSDFGIAKILESDDQVHLTQTGIGVGTPDYMAPEQWMGKVTPSIDIYSLGIVFFELITGKRPFTADTPAAILIKHINDPLPQPRHFVSGLPVEVEHIIYKALAKKAEDRYPDMESFAVALERISTLPTQAADRSDIEPGFTTGEGVNVGAGAATPAQKPELSQSVKTDVIQSQFQPETVYAEEHSGLTPPPPNTFSQTAHDTMTPVQPVSSRKKGLSWVWVAAGGLVALFTCIGMLALGVRLLKNVREIPRGQAAQVTETATMQALQPTDSDAAENMLTTQSTADETPTEAVFAGQAAVTENVALEIWLPSTEYERHFQSVCDQLTQEQENVTCEIEVMPADSYRDTVLSAVDSGSMPDLLLTWNTNFFQEDHSLFLPAEYLVENMEVFVPEILAPLKDGSTHWAVPFNSGTHLVLYYNQDLLENPPSTSQDLALLSSLRYQSGEPGLVFTTDSYFILPWLGGYGGEVFAEDGKTPTLNTPQMVSMLMYVQDLKSFGMPDGCCDYSMADQMFKEGSASLIISGNWAFLEYQTALGDALGVAPIPEVSETGIYAAPYLDPLVIVGAADLEGSRLAAARQFVAFVLKKENQLRQIEESVIRLPATNEAFLSPQIQDDPLLAGMAAQVTHTVPLPNSKEMTCIWEAMSGISGLWTYQITPDNAAVQAQRDAEACIAALP